MEFRSGDFEDQDPLWASESLIRNGRSIRWALTVIKNFYESGVIFEKIGFKINKLEN